MSDDWRTDAACLGMVEVFFARPAERRDEKAARETIAADTCTGCPVFVACRHEDDQTPELERYGYRAGRTETERNPSSAYADAASKRRTRNRPRPRCGTVGAYRRHMSDGELPCSECREAMDFFTLNQSRTRTAFLQMQRANLSRRESCGGTKETPNP